MTISGPPHILDKLLLSSFLAGLKSFPAEIHGPYHAVHAYSQADVEHIVASALDGVEYLEQVALTPCLSSVNGTIVRGNTYGELMRVFIADVLVNQVRIDRIVNSLSAQLLENEKGIITQITPVNTTITTSLAAALTQGGHQVQINRAQPMIDQEVDEMKTGSLATILNHSTKIAIVGFSGRFPAADGLAEFWDVLRQGLDVHAEVPLDRFDGTAHYDAEAGEAGRPRRKNTSHVKHGCWIRDPGLFDARFFHMSPREAEQTDPAQRLALLTAYEALEMAGMVPDRTASSARHRVGVFYGTTSDDWREVNSGQDIGTYFIPGGFRAFGPGRINYHFKFSGPSLSVDTACSSSLAAIDIACASLLRRDCDTAVAGGTNIMTNPDNFAGLDRGHFLSPTGVSTGLPLVFS